MGHVRYVDEMRLREYRIVKGPDVNGNVRAVIVFVLEAVRIGERRAD